MYEERIFPFTALQKQMSDVGFFCFSSFLISLLEV